MKKLSKSAKKKMEPLLSVGKLAKRELADALKSYHQQRRLLLQNQMLQSLKASRKADRDLSKKMAEFRSKHSKKINAAALSSPKCLSQFIDQHFRGMFGDHFGKWHGVPPGDRPGPEGLPGGFPEHWREDQKGDPGWNEFVMVVKILQGYIDDRTVIDPSFLVKPIILSCPTLLNIGEEYTITGERFGAGQGSAYITINDTGMRINLSIIEWCDTSIRFITSWNVSGVPFHARGTLTVEQNGRDYVAVTVEPLCSIYFDEQSSSDVGQAYGILGRNWWYTYEREILFTSKALPQEYRLLVNPAITAAGLNIEVYDNNSIPSLESPSKIGLLTGPDLEDNRLKAKAKVTDDWYWDYIAVATFFIEIPQGLSTNGWSGL